MRTNGRTFFSRFPVLKNSSGDDRTRAFSDCGAFSECGEAGFTFIETMAALAVLSVIGAALWTGFFSSTVGIERGIGLVREHGTALLARELLSRELSRIRVPFWEREPEGFSEQPGTLTVPFLDGEKDAVMVLRAEEDAIVLDRGGETIRIHAAGTPELSFLSGPGGPWGVLVNAGTFELRVPFGAPSRGDLSDTEAGNE